MPQAWREARGRWPDGLQHSAKPGEDGQVAQPRHQPVQRGQYLGELTRNPPFNYACGRGLSRHLHFVSSDPHLIIQGHDLSDIAAVATCCRDVPIFISENERVD